MKKITTVISENRTFIVARDERGYWGIEDKYIDADGKLAVQLNGVSGFLHDKLQDTVNAIIFQTRFDALIKQGLSFQDAAMQLMAN